MIQFPGFTKKKELHKDQLEHQAGAEWATKTKERAQFGPEAKAMMREEKNGLLNAKGSDEGH